MNSLHLTVLKMNVRRYFRGSMLFPVIMVGIFWVANFSSGFGNVERMGFAILVTFAFALLFSAFFWQYGWAVGSVDPITGLHTEKFKKDRLYIPYVTCLPLDRTIHYAIQVLLYVIVSVFICLISFTLQLVSSMAQKYMALFAYIHLLLFATLIFFGGLQTLLTFPLAFRGAIKNYKHPLALLGLALWIPFMVAVAISFPSNRGESAQPNSDHIVAILTHPALLIFLLLAGTTFLVAGGYIFNKVDIK